ncbi:winged helix-turn-helix domain-containing protein [Kocuria massiliensis]|uniref:winged helix-turn-helix domain-containing protein n=1 Tax=Kocuria massiliensis TaxID=1926282 RepID=UPI0022B99700|nr:winged helix-turn-helix domain-containing protein [Kocuria massiliensis]
MTGAPGYVHISQRNRANGTNPAMRHATVTGRGAVGEPTDYRSLRAMNPAATTHQGENGTSVRPVTADNEARGFVLYVGLNEDVAAQNGTSLVRMVQDIRAYAQTLVPQAESYAAVAIAPAGAEGSDLEVVRDALGDPTAPKSQAEVAPLGHMPSSETKPNQPAGVLIDLSRREVFLDGEVLNLTYKEFELLNYLVENSSRTAGREELLESLWRDADETPNERTIDVHIRRLRSKLGRLSNTVRTVRGQGYRFYEHPEVVVWAAPEYSI